MDNTGLAAGLGLHPDYASPLKFNDPGLSLVKGSEQHPLSKLSLGQLLEQQARKYPQREAIVVPWTGERLTYYQLNENSRAMAKGLLALGVGPDDRVGISSGNCGRYVELFFAICRIGAMALVMNPAYTVDEYEHALRHAGQSNPTAHYHQPT
jgi:acyl-CoA synthetase (AMP-forming)/AMP-acid ligase II